MKLAKIKMTQPMVPMMLMMKIAMRLVVDLNEVKPRKLDDLSCDPIVWTSYP